MAFAERVSHYQDRVEAALERYLEASGATPERLADAMRYSVLGGGKRVRPLLVYTAGAACDVAAEGLDGPAAAVELIHAYSLVHDDLPAMDDSDWRRGRVSCHKAFDEATAILVGDALQVLAFKILASDEAMVPEASVRLRMIDVLAQASGPAGMAGGQALDLAATGQRLSEPELERMHALKTGALIRASVLLGALSNPGLSASDLERLDLFSRRAGLAFQIRDDILDVEGDLATLGKQPGIDEALDKATYASIKGLDAAREQAERLHGEALAAIETFGEQAESLRQLSAYIIERRS